MTTDPFAHMHLQWFDEAAAEGTEGEPAGAPPEPAYLSQLSPELRQDKAILEAIKDSPKLNDLVKSHADLVKSHAAARGKLSRAIIIPNAEKPDVEEVKAFREALGIPENQEGYVLAAEGFKDIQGVEEVQKMVRERASAMHLSKTQAQGLFETIMGLSKSGRDQAARMRTEMETSFEKRLLDEVGGNAERAKSATNLMKSFLVKQIGDEEIIRGLAESGLMFNPKFAMKAASIAEALGEEPFIAGGGQGKGAKPAPKGTMGNYSKEFAERFGPNQKE